MPTVNEPPIPGGIAEADLRAAVAGNRSWRAVLRAFGSTSAHLGRQLRAACDQRGIDYSHFSLARFDDATLARAVRASDTWEEVLARLGYSRGSGTARATVRKHCKRLGLDTGRFDNRSAAGQQVPPELAPQPDHLRVAGPHLVVAALILLGCPTSIAPEGAPYDLVADMPGHGLQRLQVKTTTYRPNSTASWICGLSRSEYLSGVAGGHGRMAYSSNEIDAFACVDGDGAIYLIPFDAVEGRAAISLRKYAHCLLPVRLVGLTVSEFRTSLTGVSGHR